MGELGPVRPALPRGVRRRRRRLHHAVRRHRGARPGRPVDGHHPRGRRRPRAPTRSSSSAPRSSASSWLPDLCAGRALGGFGLTEPEAGSDAGGTRTRAVLDEATGEWVIDGEKAFITNSGTPITSLVTVTARTEPAGSAGPRSARSSCPPARPGFEVQPPYRKMGWHASDTHGLTLHRLPRARAEPARRAGPGLRQLPRHPRRRPRRHRRARRRRDPGLPRAVASQYAKDRNAFGKPIGANQAVAFKCADLAVMADDRPRPSPTRRPG